MLTTPRNPLATRRSGRAAVVAAVLAGLLAVAAVPPVIERSSQPGDAITLTPAVRRTADGSATVQLDVGTDAPGDVVVTWSLREVALSAEGEVTPAEGTAPGTPPAATRLRPGESGRFRVTVPTGAAPTLLVARVRGARAPGATAAPDATELATLLLSGPPAEAVTLTLDRRDDELTAQVRADRPTLVTVRLRGSAAVTYPERLVTPDAPLVVTGTPARWPVPSLVSVTDETGATTTGDTGTSAVAVLAAGFVLLAAGGVAVTARRRRSASGQPA